MNKCFSYIVIFVLSFVSNMIQSMQFGKFARHRIHPKRTHLFLSCSLRRAISEKKQEDPYLVMRKKLKKELRTVKAEIVDFRKNNELMMLQMKIDAKREELNKLRNIESCLLFGGVFNENLLLDENMPSELFFLREDVRSRRAINAVPYKVVPKNLLPVLRIPKAIPIIE